MLLGLRYHHGNGDPFYYKPDPDDGMPIFTSIIDARTMEPVVVPRKQNGAYNIVVDDKINRVLANKSEAHRAIYRAARRKP